MRVPAASQTRPPPAPRFNKVAVIAILDGRVLLVKDKRHDEMSVVTGGILIQKDAKPEDDIDAMCGAQRWGRNGVPRSYLAGTNHMLVGAAREAALREMDEETHGTLRGVRADEAKISPVPIDVCHTPDPSKGQRGSVTGRYYVAVVDLGPWAERRGWTGGDRAERLLAEIRAAPRAAARSGEEAIEDWRFEAADEVLLESTTSGRRLWPAAATILMAAGPLVRGLTA